MNNNNNYKKKKKKSFKPVLLSESGLFLQELTVEDQELKGRIPLKINKQGK